MTVTDEINQAKASLVNNGVYNEPGFGSTKEAVQARLGGEFDYNGFSRELGDIMEIANDVMQDFQNSKIEIPEPDAKTKLLIENMKKNDPSIFSRELLSQER
jgi:hypothetical protein